VISYGNTQFQHISSTPGYKDAKSSHQINKACYPFKDAEEVEIVDWLLCNHLSNVSINDFVKTKYVSGILTTTPESFIHVLQYLLRSKAHPSPSSLPIPSIATLMNSLVQVLFGRLLCSVLKQVPQKKAHLQCYFIVTQLVQSDTYSPTLLCKKGFNGLPERFSKMKGRHSVCFPTYLQEIGGGIPRYAMVLHVELCWM